MRNTCLSILAQLQPATNAKCEAPILDRVSKATPTLAGVQKFVEWMNTKDGTQQIKKAQKKSAGDYLAKKREWVNAKMIKLKGRDIPPPVPYLRPTEKISKKKRGCDEFDNIEGADHHRNKKVRFDDMVKERARLPTKETPKKRRWMIDPSPLRHPIQQEDIKMEERYRLGPKNRVKRQETGTNDSLELRRRSLNVARLMYNMFEVAG